MDMAQEMTVLPTSGVNLMETSRLRNSWHHAVLNGCPKLTNILLLLYFTGTQANFQHQKAVQTNQAEIYQILLLTYQINLINLTRPQIEVKKMGVPHMK